MSTVKLSAAIITFNEEANITRCLASLSGIVDEIVVVDSFSTDRTKEICVAHGVHFVEHIFEGHIQQKNFALSICKYPLVISLDADEALSDTLRQSILTVKMNWNADGFIINRLTNYCGKWIRHGGWYPDLKLRLWDSSKGRWAGVNPHDEFIMESGSIIKQLNGDLLHFSYYSIHQHLAQVNKFTDIMANELYHQKVVKGNLSLIIRPFWKFFRDYFIKLGFLDGYYGFVICKISAFATFIKYLKLKERYKTDRTLRL